MKKTALIFLISIVLGSITFSQNRYSSWDVFKYSGPGLKQLGWLATRHSKEIKSSLWSVGCETLDRDYAKFSIYKNYVGELGVKYGRLQSGWVKCEKQKGKYNFEWLDSCVYGLAEQSVEPWVCLCYGNPLYGSEILLGAKIFTDDKTMAAWLRYVEATVNRYKNTVKMWEVWNEPNNTNGSSKEYANLLIKTAETIKTADPQLDMPEIIRYAKSKNVRILVWLYSSDVNRNSAYKEVFPLYKKWGIAGVKIDFMDRDDQEMVNWYHDIIKCAAENQLLVVFHGAYKPDGIIRTYPNMITREGVMGNEYYNFSNKMSPEHNVKLAFTRMLAGEMDYTPGGFLNVTKEEFKNQRPTVVANTRAAELSKFVIYESPLTIVCDHPDNIINQPGADFLKIVPTTWDNIKYLGGYPGEYIALAKQKGDTWYFGVMNNSIRKEVEIKLDFLAAGNYEMEVWADSPESDIKPKELQRGKEIVKNGETLKINMAKNGGFVSVIRGNKSKKIF